MHMREKGKQIIHECEKKFLARNLHIIFLHFYIQSFVFL